MFRSAGHVRIVLWTILIGLIALTMTLQGQTVSATLTGTVADATGAVVPNAKITLKNAASGDIRRTTSNSEGYFTFASVPPGTYNVLIEAQGFTAYETKDVKLDPGDKRNLSDIALKIGQSTESVTVVSAADTITPVDSGEKSAVIGQRELQNISIVGRNAAEFIKILPGMAMTTSLDNRASFNGESVSTGSGPIGSFSANGGRTASLDITADGAHIIDPGCNCGQAVNTNGDMMQEMKVLTSNFGAENQKGPVVVSAVGKSGGRDFHGEAYFYARHNALNANDWQNNKASQPKPDTKYYYPGGQIGGPVLLPWTNFNRNRDKLFFHVAYEYYRQEVDNGFYRAFVPTAEMRNGNFNQAYLDSLRGTQYIGSAIQNQPKDFANGIIPSSAFDPVGQKLINLYPLPNVNAATNGGFNYIATGSKKQNMWQFRPRVDYSISDSTKLYVSYNMQRDHGTFTDTLWWRPDPTVPYPSAINSLNRSDSISVNLTKVFSPTLTNEVVFTYTYLDLPNSFADPKKVDKAALGINYKTIFNNPKMFYLPSLTGWGDGVANLINPGGFEVTGSLYAKKALPTLADNLAKVWGTHTMKFGFYWELTSNDQPDSGNAEGEMAFADWGGNSSGNAYADMLLGRIASYGEKNFSPLLKMGYKSVDFYGQDSWKVSRRLTLDYGLRLQHLGPWYDRGSNNGLAIFDPTKYSNDPARKNDLTGILWHSKDSSVPLSGTPVRTLFYNPRVGFAYDIFGTGKTVLRGGFGVYHFHDEQNVQAPALAITQGAYSYTIPVATTISQIGSYSGSFVTPSGITVLTKGDDQQPRTMNYSFTISQRMPLQSLFEVAYVGNKSDYLSNWNNNLNQLNYVPLGAMFANNGAAFIGNTSPSGDPFRPLQNYQTLKAITHSMYSNYNSLQASWNKQSGRLTYLFNYTFSKALGIRGEGGRAVSNPLNLNDNYGVLPNDRTHIFNIAYVIEFPKANVHRFVSAFINGWQFSGITQWQSGPNLQNVASPNFNFAGYIPAGGRLPDGSIATSSVGLNSALVNGTPDVPIFARLTCDPRSNLQSGQYINGACFAAPSANQNGNFILPYVKGPAFFNNDLSMFKNFNFSEQKRLQFRFSGYNFLNHPITSFIGGDPNLNLALDASGKLQNSRFGYADYKAGHRIIQLAVKYYF